MHMMVLVNSGLLMVVMSRYRYIEIPRYKFVPVIVTMGL